MFDKRKLSVLLAVLLAIGGASGSADAQERVLVSGLASNPPNLNYHIATDVSVLIVNQTIFETLLRLDGNFGLLPGLASSWQSSPDATEYRFTLREGVKWHDGKPFTSADVKFTFEAYMPIASRSAAFAKTIKEIATPDDKTVVVTFSAPFAPFLEAVSGFWILPKHIFGDGQPVATHPANSRPVGTGPFRLESFKSGDRVIVVRNDNYWGEKTDITRIVMPVIPDGNSRMLALESGDVDYVYGSYVAKSAYERLIASKQFAMLKLLGGVSTITAHVNTKSGPLQNADVRKAIYQAIDRKTLAQRAYYGYATATRGPVPAEMAWAVSDTVDFNRDIPFDPAAARALLDKAGVAADAGGNRFAIRLAFPTGIPTLNSAAGLIKSNLADVGITVNLIAEELQIFTQRVYRNAEYELSLYFYTSFEDPNLGVARAYICNPGKILYWNASGLCDEGLDAAFAAASRTTDRTQRRAEFAKAEKRISELLHSYPVVVESLFHFARADRWDLERAHQTYPIDWSKARARK